MRTRRARRRRLRGAVDGDGLAGFDEQEVADRHVIDADVGDGAVVGDAMRRPRRAVEEGADFAAGAAIGVVLEGLAARHHEAHHERRPIVADRNGADDRGDGEDVETDRARHQLLDHPPRLHRRDEDAVRADEPRGDRLAVDGSESEGTEREDEAHDRDDDRRGHPRVAARGGEDAVGALFGVVHRVRPVRRSCPARGRGCSRGGAGGASPLCAS